MYWINNKAFKAYTISELLVVMLTSIIIIGLCYTVLQFVMRQFYNYQSIFELSMQQEVAEDVLFKDFFDHEHIIKENDFVVFYNSIDTIVYKISKENLIRGKDTLLYQTIQVNCFNLGEEVLSGPIDAIKIDFELPVKKSFFFFQYGSSSKRQYHGI